MHPKTGKVCVPFDPAEVDSFNPNECPTLTQSLREFDKMVESGENQNGKVVPCLQKSVKVFNTFLKGLKEEYTQNLVKENRKKQEAASAMDVETAF